MRSVWSRQWVPAPGRIPPSPTVHYCQPPLPVPVGSGTGPACSTPPLAPGRTRSDSIRSIRTPLLPARPLAGSAGAVLREPVLHSCTYFIIKLITPKDGFLRRLHHHLRFLAGGLRPAEASFLQALGAHPQASNSASSSRLSPGGHRSGRHPAPAMVPARHDSSDKHTNIRMSYS